MEAIVRQFGEKIAKSPSVLQETNVLKITVKFEPGLETLELEGKLAGPWVAELEQCWATARSGTANGAENRLRVHLRAITYIDAAGRELLAVMSAQGVELVAEGCMMRSIVTEILTNQGGAARGRFGGSPVKKVLSVVFLIVSLALGSGLRAEEKPPLKLTLREALGIALKQNPQVQIAVLNLAQTGQDQNIARSALLPQAQLAVTDLVRRDNLEARICVRIPNSPQHVGPLQNFQAGPQFGMPIFDLTLWRRWQSARQGVQASDAQRISVREQVTLLVVSQYLGCLRADADVRAAQSRVALAQALYNQAADLQQHGVGTGIDTLRANVQLQNEKQRLIEAQTQLKTSLYGLARLLVLDPQQEIELGDELSFFETPEFGAQQSLEGAWSARPEMRTLDATERAAYYQKRSAIEQRLPAVRFDGDWAYLGISAPSAIPTYQYQVAVSVPLWTSGRIRAEVTKAVLELKKIAQQREDLRSQIALEVKTAIAQLAAAHNEVDVANLGVKLAQEEVGQARDRFEAGVANNIEVIQAQDALARANDNQITALYRYNQSRADLARASGQMETLYTK